MDCTIPELVNMLVIAEEILKSSRGTVLVVDRTFSSKRKSDWKKKNKSEKKQKKEGKPKKDALKKAVVKEKCFYYDVDGHWRRNYSLYMESLKIKKGDTPLEGMSSMLVVETNIMIFSTSRWVLNSGFSARIYTSMQDLIERRRLRKGDMILRIGNRAKC